MNCKIYITDEGFGPIVRQNAIIEELRAINPKIDFVLQLQTHQEQASRIIRNVEIIAKHNLIKWHKKSNGSPDLESITSYYKDYEKRSIDYIKTELNKFGKQDFLISDFVYEAFEIGRLNKIPTFGIAHFTWDWFLGSMQPKPIEKKLEKYFVDLVENSERLYFPPFTPKGILKKYKHKIKEVPLIVRENVNHKAHFGIDQYKVLIIDSGAGVLHKTMQRSIEQLSKMKDFHFFVSNKIKGEAENITKIPETDLFVDYIQDMDLVIGRAGFNTISECIALRTPMLLLGEAMNPEMTENIDNLKESGLGAFIPLDKFSNDLANFLPHFIDTGYEQLLKNMKEHSFECNGAQVIAKDILNIVA